MKYCDFDLAQKFIYSNARLLDRRLFATLFEGGSHQDVLTSLHAYQNTDGGFGNALEPDLRTPASQPLAVEFAFRILDLIGDFDDPLVYNACDWLDSISTLEGGVPYALPSLESYPHSPWMRADSSHAQLNPTAGLCGLLIKHSVHHPWVKRASDYCWEVIPHYENDFYHDIMPIITFLEHVPDSHGRAESELKRFKAMVARTGVVEHNPLAVGYAKFPLDWAPRPESFLRSIFDDLTIETHLQALGAKQQPDGGWPINWPALSPAAEFEWRGWKTIETLLTLNAYEST